MNILTCAQIRLSYRFRGDNGQAALMTVDGTDFPIFEPTQFSPAWYTKKFNGPGVRYEVAVAIGTGDICWIHGPFPAGAMNDITIFRVGLKRRLHQTERVWADKGYRGDIKCITPYDAISEAHRVEMGIARGRHETINGRLASWDCLNQVWRHSRDKHCDSFTSVAVITQLEQINGFRSFQVNNTLHSSRQPIETIDEAAAYYLRRENVAEAYR
jgi:DDE superfamily endonuclease